MPAGIYNFEIEQGVTGGFTIQVWEDERKTVKRDLTGWTARMKIKRSYNALTALFSKTSPSSGLTIVDPPTEGKIAVRWEASEASAMPVGKASGDVEIFRMSGSVEEVERVIRSEENGIQITPEVTK